MRSVPFATTILSLSPVTTAWAQETDFYRHGHMWGDTGMGFGLFWGPVFMVLLVAAIVLGVLALLRQRAPDQGSGPTKGSHALDTLNLRFANGEIDAAEYTERRKLLAATS